MSRPESEELLARITSSPRGDKVGPGHNGFLSTLGLFYEFARNGERKHAPPPSFLLRPSAPHPCIFILSHTHINDKYVRFNPILENEIIPSPRSFLLQDSSRREEFDARSDLIKFP